MAASARQGGAERIVKLPSIRRTIKTIMFPQCVRNNINDSINSHREREMSVHV